MSLLPLSLWLPLSLAACVLLVLIAAGLVLRQALRIPAASKDGRNVRAIAALSCAGLLLWLAYGVFKGYAGLWQADALMILAQGSLLLQLPLLIGGMAWVAALLIARLIKMHGKLD